MKHNGFNRLVARRVVKDSRTMVYNIRIMKNLFRTKMGKNVIMKKVNSLCQSAMKALSWGSFKTEIYIFLYIKG